MLSQAELELLRRVSDRGRPPVPETPLRFALELAAESGFSRDRLIEQIETDAHVSFGLLILANSPLLIGHRTVRTVSQAVTLLGQRNCRELLWVLALSDVLQDGMPRLADRLRDRLWRHALLTGVITWHLASIVPGLATDDLLAAGMAHDLGHLLLNSPTPRLGVVWSPDDDESSDTAAQLPERDHCGLGGALLEFWNAPATLIASARFHHEPEQAPAELIPLVAGVRLADLAAESLDAEKSRRPVRLTAHPQWSRLVTLASWDQVDDLDRRLVELLPEAILRTEHLANLLARN